MSRIFASCCPLPCSAWILIRALRIPSPTAQRLLKTEQFDLCLTDMQLPDGDGLELVEWMQQYTPSVPVAVITAHGNMETAVRALKVGAFDFVSKPLDLAGLRKLVATAIKLSRSERWRHQRIWSAFARYVDRDAATCAK